MCARCLARTEFKGAVYASPKKLKTNGLVCPQCATRYGVANVANAMTLHVRQWVSQYYSTPYKLSGDDGTRARVTRNVALGGHAALVSRQYDEAWLYTQLRYLRHLMDADALWRRVSGADGGGGGRGAGRPPLPGSGKGDRSERNPLSVGDRSMYDDLLARANSALGVNGYRLVDLSVFLAPLGLG
jgi:hypothetical protein